MEKFNEQKSQLGQSKLECDQKQNKLEGAMNELQNKILSLTELTKENSAISQETVVNITDVIQYVGFLFI